MAKKQNKESQEEKLERLEKLAENLQDTYVYIKYVARYYWVELKKFFSTSETASNLICDYKELLEMREFGVIKTYENICYSFKEQPGLYNLLDKEKILKPSNTPQYHRHIQELITNICNGKQENIEWLEKCILYKYLNIDDYKVPCIVLYGKGGSGKGTLISLLSTIFGEENVTANLGQRDLSSSFDTYKGRKIIVEFAEILTNNTGSDKRILNKLKNIIFAEKITVNEKGVQAYQIENIAWVFISSNSYKPLILDDSNQGNRRFTIIKSTSKLKNGDEINKTIRNKEAVSNFLAYLLEKYPEITELKEFHALDNQDKKDLEQKSIDEANDFWDWVESQPGVTSGKKLTIEEIYNHYIDIYCSDNCIETNEFRKYFWNNSRYTKKKIRIGDKTYYGVEIE